MIRREKRRSGAYKILGRWGRELYIGVSHNIRHRLSALLYGRADYKQVETKRKLRRLAKSYQTLYTDLKSARIIEHRLKNQMRFNKL